MMSNLLRDIIKARDVVAFINDIMVEMKIEEEHDEIVEKSLRRMVENNLFVKPEKCVWKVRKVGFLGVVIGPDGIEIEKEKVQEVVNWPVPRNVKDM